MSETDLPRLDWRVILNRTTPPRRAWGRVRAAQLKSIGMSLKFAMWGQVLNALIMAWVLDGQVPREQLIGWLAVVLGCTFVTLLVWRQWRGRELHSVSRRAIDRIAYHAALFGCIWAWPASYVFDMVGHSEQLLICVVTVCMMAGAAFTFATVPSAAGAYIVSLGSATANMLSSDSNPLMHMLSFAYTGGLFLIIMNNGRMFMERKCVELALAERTDTVSLLLREYENSDADWLWQTNSQLCFQQVSARFARAVGQPVGSLEGASILSLLARPEDLGTSAARTLGLVHAALDHRSPFAEMVVPVAGSDGLKWIELSARPRYSSGSRFLGYRGVGSDVTEARRTAERIEHMARHDALTGLPNRLQLTEDLSSALERATRLGRACAMLLIDIDRFKTVNDSLGHVAGDNLLRQIAARFAPLLGRGVTAGRLGGDEFAMIVADASDSGAVQQLALQLVDSLDQPFVYDGQHLFVGASIGIAFGPINGPSVEDLIRNADLALYQAKNEGGNRVCFYDPSLHAQVEERRLIELVMRSALDNEEFALAYQPVIDAKGDVVALEALLRWQNEELGVIEPARFIPIAEETGFLARLGEWVLRRACAEAALWPSHVKVAVNVSPRQLQDAGFLLTLVSALSHAGLDPRRLELEITETVFLNLTSQTQKALQQIRGLGVGLSLDDFGTGYSSLGYLREGDFDTLKIDQSFIRDVRQSDAESTAIVRAVVALADSLGLRTVAEGVETEEQLKIVRGLGCDLAQGFLISNPLPAADARALLGARRGLAAA